MAKLGASSVGNPFDKLDRTAVETEGFTAEDDSRKAKRFRLDGEGDAGRLARARGRRRMADWDRAGAHDRRRARAPDRPGSEQPGSVSSGRIGGSRCGASRRDL